MSKAIFETLYHIVDENDTTYVLRPNPDTNDGFKGGAYLGWYDTDPKQARDNEVFIDPSALRKVAEAFSRAAAEAELREEDY